MTSIINEFKNVESKSAIIKIVGVGGGGGNAVNNMYNVGIEGVSYMLCNTDKTALENSPVPHRLQIGPGLGAGNKPEIACSYAEAEREKIKEALNDGTQMVFITTGMGGGTGTGASPIVAEVAKESGLLTVGIATLPFKFEGKKKIRKAIDGIVKMAPNVDAMLVINNERLTLRDGFKLPECFKTADSVLLNAAKSISDIINIPGYINLDFNDVRTTLEDGKLAIINTGVGDGAENRVQMAIQDAMTSDLLNNKNIFNAKKILLNFYCSEDYAIEGPEIQQITEFTERMEEEEDMDVIWGVTYDNTLDTKVKVTLLAAGLGEIIADDYREEYLKIDKDQTNKKTSRCKLEAFDTDDGLLEMKKQEEAYKRRAKTSDE